MRRYRPTLLTPLGRAVMAAALSAAVTLYALGAIITHIAQPQHGTQPTTISDSTP
ncbi:MAG: hypothetical protein WCD42_05425 [Rhizomicrobium sp.]